MICSLSLSLSLSGPSLLFPRAAFFLPLGSPTEEKWQVAMEGEVRFGLVWFMIRCFRLVMLLVSMITSAIFWYNFQGEVEIVSQMKQGRLYV